MAEHRIFGAAIELVTHKALFKHALFGIPSPDLSIDHLSDKSVDLVGMLTVRHASVAV